MEEYIGTVKPFAFGFTPRGWLACDGQLLSISQFTTLFSLLGTTYGGDGRTTFGLPDLRGHAPIGDGRGPGLTDRRMGQKGGSETNTLNVTQMASHNHTTNFTGKGINANVGVPAVNDDGSTDETEGTILANSAGRYAAASAADTTLSAFNAGLTGTATSSSNGSGSPVNNMEPFLAVNYCICNIGIYPPRN